MQTRNYDSSLHGSAMADALRVVRNYYAAAGLATAAPVATGMGLVCDTAPACARVDGGNATCCDVLCMVTTHPRHPTPRARKRTGIVPVVALAAALHPGAVRHPSSATWFGGAPASLARRMRSAKLYATQHAGIASSR